MVFSGGAARQPVFHGNPKKTRSLQRLFPRWHLMIVSGFTTKGNEDTFVRYNINFLAGLGSLPLVKLQRASVRRRLKLTQRDCHEPRGKHSQVVGTSPRIRPNQIARPGANAGARD
jgi:hypothetical protein